jgi:hypothetical protein
VTAVAETLVGPDSVKVPALTMTVAPVLESAKAAIADPARAIARIKINPR